MAGRTLSSTIWVSIILLMLFCASCSQTPSTLNPQGFASAQIGELSWILLGLGGLIYVGVSSFLLFALFRRRNREDALRTHEEDLPASTPGIVLWGGVAMPAIVLLGVFGLTLNTLMRLSVAGRSDEITINVIGHQWWWEVVYPEYGVVTANEIHIPVGQQVRINLSAEDVIHSFWVPQLHGKLDMIPGQTNTFLIQADTAGEYRGLCAEFCGIQHARMLFLVVAEPPTTFAAWLDAQATPAVAPADALAQEGQAIFLRATCHQCHTIAGTTAAGQLGPNLTHFASRREIGAGTLPNTRGTLAGWIVNPQSLKPGNLMPATVLSGAELQALLAYMESLE